jgi:hypothetical protein
MTANWDEIVTKATVLAWKDNGFRQRLQANQVEALREEFGVEVSADMPRIEIPAPPQIDAQPLQASRGAEAAYPFTCC